MKVLINDCKEIIWYWDWNIILELTKQTDANINSKGKYNK